MLNRFNIVLENALKNYKDLDFVQITLVNCKVCKRTLTVIVKKSLVEKSERTTTPMVYVKSCHALLLYIDKQYKIRGNEIVSASY